MGRGEGVGARRGPPSGGSGGAAAGASRVPVLCTEAGRRGVVRRREVGVPSAPPPAVPERLPCEQVTTHKYACIQPESKYTNYRPQSHLG